MHYRPLGSTGIQVSEIALGCWPMVDTSNPSANAADGVATIRACFDLGVNLLDTAYMYGIDGASERLIAQGAGKPAQRDADCHQVRRARSPRRLRDVRRPARHAAPRMRGELRRLNTDHVDLLYLHAPDKQVPVADSAGELKRLLEEGKTRAVGASNLNLAQLREFASACALTAFQPPYNMLMRQIEADILPWCREHGVAVFTYWPLMKGLFSGKFRRDQVLEPATTAITTPCSWAKNGGRITISWTGSRRSPQGPGTPWSNWFSIGSSVRPVLLACSAGLDIPIRFADAPAAAVRRLTTEQLAQIDQALAERGEADVRVP